ncbi:MAG TPA: hypothetical protein VFY83_11825 [Anaerolineales bacterium]|jgi:hypothetical protein|nr:hypothetical protein [Anaerolineales bacterium]
MLIPICLVNYVRGQGAIKHLSFARIDKGPVQIESNVNIIASQRVIYTVDGVKTSFSEMMALPASQLDTTVALV